MGDPVTPDPSRERRTDTGSIREGLIRLRDQMNPSSPEDRLLNRDERDLLAAAVNALQGLEAERDEARSQEETWREIADDQADRADAAEQERDEWERAARAAAESEDAAESRTASLEKVLGGLAEAAGRFSTEADYSVSVSTEEDFAAALESARALSRSSSPDTSETGGSE